MNIATSEPSLYQLTQDLDEPLASLSVGAETLRSYASSIIDLLIEEQIRATVLGKITSNKKLVKPGSEITKRGKRRDYLFS